MCPQLLPTGAELAMREHSQHLTLVPQPMFTIVITDVIVIQ